MAIYIFEGPFEEYYWWCVETKETILNLNIYLWLIIKFYKIQILNTKFWWQKESMCLVGTHVDNVKNHKQSYMDENEVW